MTKTKKTPEQRVEERIGSILLCFVMTTFGLISILLSFLILLLPIPDAQSWSMSVFSTSLAVAEVFGLTAVVLFLTAPSMTLRRLLKGRTNE